MRWGGSTKVYVGRPDEDDPFVERVFLCLPHRVYLTKQDMTNGKMQPKRWRWAWWEYVFRRSCRYVDLLWYEYFFDEALEAKVQKKLAQRDTLMESAKLGG